MKDTKLDVYVTVPLDKELAEKLQQAANQETEGNRSLYVRRLIRIALGAVPVRDECAVQEQAA